MANALAVKNCFMYNETTKENKCLLENCEKKIKSSSIYNLKRHIQTCHKRVAQTMNFILEDENDENQEKGPSPLKKKKIQIAMCKTTYLNACIKLATVHSVPFSMFEYEGFQDIVEPIQNALGVKVNSHNIASRIAVAAQQIKKQISEYVSNKMVCLKIDAATRCDRSILGINIQYLCGKKVIVRTLGMIEIAGSHTGENLKNKIISVLHKYRISIRQVYSTTTDNGANMLKAVRLMQKSLDEDEPQTYDDEDNSDDQQNNIETLLASIGNSVRCAAHTLQLAVHDVLKDYEGQLKSIVSVVKKLRLNRYRRLFSANLQKIPCLDVITRWNSSYIMIKCLTDQQEFIKGLIENDDEIAISEELWLFMLDFMASFKPLFIATKQLQEEQLTMGDFYRSWLECELELASMEEDNQFAEKLLAAMANRKKKLFENNTLIAAIYMDPRFNFVGSDLLTESEKLRAKV